jgi:universal bacterial protein YeaZ
MLTLSIDTSANTASVALARDGAIIGSIRLNAGLTHSQTLLPAVDSLLALTVVSKKQLDKIAVCVGPGSFTGLRIGVAAAKGLALALGVNVIALSTLNAIAASVPQTGGSIFPCIEARRGTVYNAVYDKNLNEITAPRQILLSEIENENVVFDTDITAGLAASAALLAEPLDGINPSEITPFYLRKALEQTDV